jgi:UDP-glucose:(heptosyl)LPS alpha-1,3-glucosyltransferase
VHVFAREAEPSPDVRLHHVTAPRAWQPLRVIAFSRAVERATRSGEFDVVYSLARTARQHIYRAGAGCHEDFLERCHAGGAHALRRVSPRHRTLIALERRVFADPTQLVICNSEMVRGEIQDRYRVPVERLALVRNGVDLDLAPPEQRAAIRERLRAELDPLAAATIWLFAGHAFERKGLDTALRALAAAKQQETHLWIAGGGDAAPWRGTVRRLGLDTRVRFLGNRSDLQDVFAAVDGLLLPTRYDAFANVCLEAAAAGIPVLTSDANGAGELFSALFPGVFRPDDIAGYAGALDSLSDKELRERAGAETRAVAERHSWERHIVSIREIFLRRRSSTSNTSSTNRGPDRRCQSRT